MQRDRAEGRRRLAKILRRLLLTPRWDREGRRSGDLRECMSGEQDFLAPLTRSK